MTKAGSSERANFVGRTPVGRRRFQGRIRYAPGTIHRKACVPGALLLLLFAASQSGIAQCTEKPVVWMNERTAASHLIASRRFVFPAVIPALAQIRTVVVVATVNRKGNVCEAKAKAGPIELRQVAEKIVRSSWRYRPFLLDWKPVTAQFPVRVNFVISADRKDALTPEVAGAYALPKDSWAFPRGSSVTART